MSKIPKWLTKERVVFLIILILLSILFESIIIRTKNETMEAIKTASMYDKTSQEFEVVKSKGKEVIVKQDQVLITEKHALQSKLITKKEYRDNKIKNLKSKINISQNVEVKKKIANYNKESIVKNVDSLKYLAIPRKFTFEDSLLFFSGTITNKAVILDSLKMKNDFSIYVADDVKLLKKRNPVIKYVSNNPNVSISKINNVVIRKEKKWYERGWLKCATGIVIGVAICKM